MTRREVADRLYISMIEEGAHPRHPGFLMLNSSTRYDDRRYNKGDRMIADFGACYEGYYGDVTRMTIFAAVPTNTKRIMKLPAMSSIGALSRWSRHTHR